MCNGKRVRSIQSQCRDFIRDEEGLSVVEYVVGAALLVAALGALFAGFGTTLNNKVDGALS